MGLFVKGTMQPVGLSAKETQEMLTRGEQAMRGGTIRPVGSLEARDAADLAYKKRKPRKK